MAIYHLNVGKGSKAKGAKAAGSRAPRGAGAKASGQSGGASAKADYLARAGKYTNSRGGREEVVLVESGHMPEWATAGRGLSAKSARAYWEAGDEHERKNGVVFREVEFALPLELDEGQRLALARQFAAELATTADGPLPYTLAVHAGKGTNPHVHVMVSERVNDGHERTPETWFKRAAASPKGRKLDAASGGARKTTELRGDWLERTRALWAQRANEALAAHGHAERIDHRSHAERGLDVLPSQHIGPNAMEMEQRTGIPSIRRGWVQARSDLRPPLPRIAPPRAATAPVLVVSASPDPLVALRPQNAPTALQTALAALSRLEERRHELEQRRVAAFAGLGRLSADLAGRVDWMAAARTSAREPERPALAAGERAERLQRLNGELAAASHECGQRAGALPERVRQAADRVLRAADQAAGRAVARQQAPATPAPGATFTPSLDTLKAATAKQKPAQPSTDNSVNRPAPASPANPMQKALEARRRMALGGKSIAVDAVQDAAQSAMASAKSPQILLAQLKAKLLALVGRMIELHEGPVRQDSGTVIAANERWAAMHVGRDTRLIDRELWPVEEGRAYSLKDGPSGRQIELRPVNSNTASTLEYVYGKQVGELARQWAERDRSLVQSRTIDRGGPSPF